MKIGVLKETFPGERRVALTPNLIAPLVKAGHEIIVETSAGQSAGFPDSQYVEKGAKTVARSEVFAAELLLQVRGLGANPEAGRADLEHFERFQTLIALCDPLSQPQLAKEISGRGVTLFALELMPRITRAQSMDVLSSMATVAGYRAVLLGATALPKMFPMMTTAAGTITPAKVFVMGAGVAGLQAIASARRLGAQVSATDVRSAVREQIQSLGARFIETPVEAGKAEGTGGYAKALDDQTQQLQREAMSKVVAESDLVITTAAIPGKKAPILVTKQMVERMQPGAVLVDLAAERGGNCELTKPGQTVMVGGVTILGPDNLPAEVPYHASQMFGKNVVTFLQHLVGLGLPGKVNTEDEITRETLICRDGELVNSRVRQLLGMDIALAK
ncbi:MAG TPA: Re/Si-specific NAD(P)(+) transhydrogenase subunit alpha [Pirellulales bacterium]|jgi:NAD(P) transhydrogenase subunit alpha|nr:Re/Si-specific NAD(P)(+) transhydrogenase subunit alpha [Pirellulales bacterium]